MSAQVGHGLCIHGLGCKQCEDKTCVFAHRFGDCVGPMPVYRWVVRGTGSRSRNDKVRAYSAADILDCEEVIQRAVCDGEGNSVWQTGYWKKDPISKHAWEDGVALFFGRRTKSHGRWNRGKSYEAGGREQ